MEVLAHPNWAAESEIRDRGDKRGDRKGQRGRVAMG